MKKSKQQSDSQAEKRPTSVLVKEMHHSSMEPYVQAEFGAIYSGRSLVKAYLAQTSKELTEQNILDSTRRLLVDMSQAEVPSSFAHFRQIPYYLLSDSQDLPHIGLDGQISHRWLSRMYSDKTAGPKLAQDAMSLLCSESTGWKLVRRLSLDSRDHLLDKLKEMQKLWILKNDWRQSTARLADAASIRRFVVLDIEAYERVQDRLTEIGLAIYDRGTGKTQNIHIIILENIKLSNKRYSRDAKFKFAFGKSLRMSTDGAMLMLQDILREPSTALVCHAMESDLAYLRRARIAKKKNLVPKTLLEDIPKFDLQHLHRCQIGAAQSHSLERVCEQLNVKCKHHMHNAGNDAEYTLRAFRKLMQIGSDWASIC